MKKAELTDQHHELKNTYKTIEFLTSVFNKRYLEFIKDLKLESIKIASMEINNTDLIDNADKIFKQVFISTGATKLNEIEEISKRLSSDKFVFFHCVSAYPTPPENINLPRINFLKTKFKRVGYSGHLKGVNDAIAALSYKPEFIEKHFTIDNNLLKR